MRALYRIDGRDPELRSLRAHAPITIDESAIVQGHRLTLHEDRPNRISIGHLQKSAKTLYRTQMKTYVIGDLQGCAHEAGLLLERIAADAQAHGSRRASCSSAT